MREEELRDLYNNDYDTNLDFGEFCYNKGKTDAYKEIAYSDCVAKEQFEKLACKQGRADERAKVLDLLDRHLWNYSKEGWADFQSVLKQLKEQNK